MTHSRSSPPRGQPVRIGPWLQLNERSSLPVRASAPRLRTLGGDRVGPTAQVALADSRWGTLLTSNAVGATRSTGLMMVHGNLGTVA